MCSGTANYFCVPLFVCSWFEIRDCNFQMFDFEQNCLGLIMNMYVWGAACNSFLKPDDT